MPRSINEGGELGYSLSHVHGAAFDNPDLIVACVDGEATEGNSRSHQVPAADMTPRSVRSHYGRDLGYLGTRRRAPPGRRDTAERVSRGR